MSIALIRFTTLFVFASLLFTACDSSPVAECQHLEPEQQEEQEECVERSSSPRWSDSGGGWVHTYGTRKLGIVLAAPRLQTGVESTTSGFSRSVSSMPSVMRVVDV